MLVLQDGYEAALTHKVWGHTTVWLATGLARGALLAAERELRHGKEKIAWREVERACGRALASGRRFRMGPVPTLRTRGSLEWLRGRHAAAARWWDRGVSEAERLGARFEHALCLLEAGTRLGDVQRREAGLALLAAMGSCCGSGMTGLDAEGA